jgi:hypothetical protein
MPGRWELVVSLPSSQERVLHRMEGVLRDSDPRLMALFTIFSRLTREEEMPRIEELRAVLIRFRIWFSWHTTSLRRIARRRSERMQAVVFFLMALAAMSCALIISVGSHGAPRCWTASKAPAAELIVKARQCKLGLVRMPIFGH